jgi:hypothetical protein
MEHDRSNARQHSENRTYIYRIQQKDLPFRGSSHHFVGARIVPENVESAERWLAA